MAPKTEMVDLVLSSISLSMRQNWFGSHLCPFPLSPWKNWCARSASFECVTKWPANALLFVERISGEPKLVPNVEDVERGGSQSARKRVFFLRR